MNSAYVCVCGREWTPEQWIEIISELEFTNFDLLLIN